MADFEINETYGVVFYIDTQVHAALVDGVRVRYDKEQDNFIVENTPGSGWASKFIEITGSPLGQDTGVDVQMPSKENIGYKAIAI